MSLQHQMEVESLEKVCCENSDTASLTHKHPQPFQINRG